MEEGEIPLDPPLWLQCWEVYVRRKFTLLHDVRADLYKGNLWRGLSGIRVSWAASKRGLSGVRVSWAASKRGLSGVRVSWAASKRGLSGVRVSWAASKSVCQGLESAGLLPSGVKVSWAAREVCQGLESAGLLPSGVKVSWAVREVCQGLESAGLLPREVCQGLESAGLLPGEVCQGLESAGLQENSSADVALHTNSEVSVGGPWLCVDVLSVEAVIGSTAQVMHGQQVTSYLQQVTFHLQPW